MNKINTYWIIFVFSLLFINCSIEKKTIRFKRDFKSEFSLFNGERIYDSLRKFSYKVPSKKDWKPWVYLENNGSSITSGIEKDSIFYVFNVSRIKHNSKLTPEEEQLDIERKFNIIEKGEILLNNKYEKYNIVLDDSDKISMATLHVSMYSEDNEYLYTLSTSTQSKGNFKERFQRTISLFESFTMNE